MARTQPGGSRVGTSACLQNGYSWGSGVYLEEAHFLPPPCKLTPKETVALIFHAVLTQTVGFLPRRVAKAASVLERQRLTLSSA